MESDTNEPEPVPFRISIEVWADPNHMVGNVTPDVGPRNRWDAVTDIVRDHLERTFPDWVTPIGPATVTRLETVAPIARRQADAKIAAALDDFTAEVLG